MFISPISEYQISNVQCFEYPISNQLYVLNVQCFECPISNQLYGANCTASYLQAVNSNDSARQATTTVSVPCCVESVLVSSF